MEDPVKGSSPSEDRSQKTAAALRALREGLGSKLENHRRRTSDMEADLNARAQEISKELAHDEVDSHAGARPHDEQIRKLRDTLAERESVIAKLQRQLSDAELHQLRLSAELTDSRSAMGAAKSKECASCNALRSQLTNAKEDVVGLEGRVEELLTVVSRAQEALVELRDAESAECTQLHAELSDKQTQLDAATEQVLQLEARVGSLGEELAQSRDAEQKLRDQHNADNAAQIKAQLAIAHAQQELTEKAEELAAANSRESQANERIEELLRQVDALTAELTESRETQSRLAEQNSVVDTSLAEAHSAAADLKRQLDEQSAELSAAAERDVYAGMQIDELRAQVDALNQELTRTRETESQLAADQSHADSMVASLQQALAEAQQSLEDRNSELAVAIEAQTESKLRCDELQQSLADRATELGEINERESQAHSRIKELSDQVDELTAKLDAAETAAAELQTLHSADDTALLESRRAAEDTRRLLEERTAELEAKAERELAMNSRVETLLGQVESLTTELTAAREAESKLLAKHSATDAALAESQDAAAETEQRLMESKDEIAAITLRESKANVRIDELAQQVDALTVELTAARELEMELRNQQAVDDTALTEAKTSAEEAQQLLQAQLADLAIERETLAEELAQVRGELAARAESATNEVSWLEKEREAAEKSRDQLAADFEELLKQQKLTEAALADAQAKSDQVTQALQGAEAEIAKLTVSTEEELVQARKKFELALADAQKLKRENTELQEELARRPEVAESESPELVSLRVERDALAARIAELEAAPASTVDEDSEQRFADLQRRFELAVEDLRRLKQENSQLQDKLAHAPQGSSGPSSGVSNQAMDWQAQKARLLAALESEEAEENSGPERQQELVTIEGTISITDQVVAEKDREIAELREQLAVRPSEVIETSPEAELLDKDELVAAERAKLEALQKEWHEKLRAAELEMSVQRATLARREAEIEHKIQEVQQAQADPATGADGKPRRRWLSALGLREDDDGKK